MSAREYDIAGEYFFSKWPDWLRWILFLPTAVIGSLLVSTLFNVIFGLFSDNASGSIEHGWFGLIASAILGAAFVSFAAYVAPRSQFEISLGMFGILAVLVTMIWVRSYDLGYYKVSKDLLFYTLHSLVVVGAGLFSVIYIRQDIEEHHDAHDERLAIERKRQEHRPESHPHIIRFEDLSDKNQRLVRAGYYRKNNVVADAQILKDMSRSQMAQYAHFANAEIKKEERRKFFGYVAAGIVVLIVIGLYLANHNSNKAGATTQGSSSSSSENCSPEYSGCVPNVSYDLDCSDIGHRVTVIGRDVYHLDADHDGTGCESY